MKKTTSLVGLYFYIEAKEAYCGRVVTDIYGQHLVQLYDAIDGTPNLMRLYDFKEMKDFRFFHTRQMMTEHLNRFLNGRK